MLKKLLLILTVGLASLVLLGAVGLGLFLVTFNPNSYKGQIRAAAEKATGRMLRFDGDLEIMLFPAVGLKTGKLILSDPEEFGAEPFLTVESASFALALEPLLQHILAVEDVMLNGARLKLVHSTAGSKNWEYGFGKKAEGAPSAVFAADKSSLAAANALPLPAPSAPTPGAITPGTSETPAQAQENTVVLRIERIFCNNLNIIYQDMRKGRAYSAQLATLAISGAHGSDSDIPLEASGALHDETRGYGATFHLKAQAHANSGGKMAARIDQLSLVAHGIADTPLNLDASCDLAWQPAEATLAITNLQTKLSLAPSGEEMKEAVCAVLQARLFLTAAKEGQAPFLSGEIYGAQCNLDALLARIQTLPESTGQGSVKGAPNLTNPRVRGKREKDLDPPCPPGEEQEKAESPAFSTDLLVNAEDCIAGGIFLDAARLHVFLQENRADVPYTVNLFGGTASGTFWADLGGKSPTLRLICEVANLDLEKATNTPAGEYVLTGLLNASADVTGQGDSAQTILHSLKGKASAHAMGGKIQGFRLIPPDLPRLAPVPVDFPYTLLAASAAIHQGTATTRDITLQSPVLTGQGGGVIRLPFSQLDLGLDFMLAGLPPAVPVSISGPFHSPSCAVDMRAFLRNVAKSAAKAPEPNSSVKLP